MFFITSQQIDEKKKQWIMIADNNEKFTELKI